MKFREAVSWRPILVAPTTEAARDGSPVESQHPEFLRAPTFEEANFEFSS